jgi:Toastrack DUF4097
MRRRSFSGPLLLLLIGGMFLWRNLHPEIPVFDILARYWPFLLIAWGLLRLGEVLVWRKSGYVSFTGGEVALVVLICIAGSGLWQAHEHGLRFNTGGLEVFGEQFDYPISANAPAKGIKRITFENPRGNLKVVGSDGDQVTVTGHKTIRAWARKDADATDQNTAVEIVPEGDRLLIRTNQDRAPDNQRISDDLEVTVPRGVAVEARGRSNDYDVSEIAGDVEMTSDHADVRLARIGGNVRLDVARSELLRATDVKGKVEIQGSRGTDVDLENIEGQVTLNGSYTGTLEFKNLAKPLQFEGSRNTELHAQAVPGRITMDLGEVTASGVTGPMRLVTRSRDIKLEKFTQGLELETERGDIALQPTLPVPSIQARSGNGRVDLILPDKATFDLEATAERGEAFNGFGSGIRQEREGRTATLRGRVGDGPSIRLVANRGTVSVRKQGVPADFSDNPDATVPPPPPGGHVPPPPKPPKTPKELKDSEVRM